MFDRYSRQILFDGIGREGQPRLRDSRVVIIGCGALGSMQIEMLARAGVGRLRIVDRDFVEETNLHRQTLYTERDAAERLPKAIAARRRVAEVNDEVEVEPIVVDVNRHNIEELVSDASLVLDGTDNFQTRYLINDACIKLNTPWIYGAAVGSYGVTMTVRPCATPCLRCVFAEMPPPGSAPTCDTAGVIMPIIAVVAAVQTAEALKLLAGRNGDLHDSLMQFDVWRNEWRRIKLKEPAPDCLTCGTKQFPALNAAAGDTAALLCGRDAVQINPPHNSTDTGGRRLGINLEQLARRLEAIGEVRANPYLLRTQIEDYELSVFADGRAIIRGTSDIALARSLYARYVGS